MASKKNFEDLDLSQEEIKRISEALKDEKFRKMFVEYAEEISNPENRKRYEEEIAMMEQERGMDVQFVHPHPGYVVKTVVNGDKKAFINICTNEKIGAPSAKKHTDSTGKNGLNWQIPHSFSPPREDFDKNKTTCMVYDVVFHPDTLRMTNNPRFKTMVEDTAIDGIERQFQCKLDRNNIKHPKMKYKGQPVATVIRSRKDNQQKSQADDGEGNPLSGMPYPYSDKTSAELAEENCKNFDKQEKELKNKASKTKSTLEKKEENGYTTPKYSIIHRGYLELQEFTNARDSKPSTRPKELVVSIELPLCKSSAGVDLDIFEEKLVLKSEKPAYKLDLKLPYPVDDENGSAKFNKAKKCLVITLPVVAQEIPSLSGGLNTRIDSNSEQIQPPLIEELPVVADQFEQKKGDGDDELPPLEDIVNGDSDVISEGGTSVKNEAANTIAYNLPEFDYNQDKDTVTFIFHVRNVTEESVSKAFLKEGVCFIRFMSLGSGGFPMHYGFYVDFGEVRAIVPEHTTIDISERNMTVTVLKGRDSRYIWNSFLAGLDEYSLEEKLFLTTDNLNSELDQLQLEGEKMGRTDVTEPIDGEQAPSIEVTEMNKKKLTIKITEPKTKFRDEDSAYEDSPSSESIEIVHSTSPPELHGILKQRSVSESSEDHFSGSTGESSAGSSPREGECPKHVTFNSRVDRTMFQSNAATKTIKTALKNKRKSERKREAKREKGRRRRHNSTGSEYSSCDDADDSKLSSESHSEDDHEDLSEQMIATGNKVENSGVIEEEDEKSIEKTESGPLDPLGHPKHAKRQSRKNRNKKNKLVEEVKSKMAEVKTDKCDSDDDDDYGVLDERTSKEGEVENAEKDVGRTSSIKVSVGDVNDLGDIVDQGTAMAAINDARSGEPGNPGTSDAIKGENLQSNAIKGDNGDNGAIKEGDSGEIKGDNQSICDQKNIGIDKMEDGYHEKANEEHKGNRDQEKSKVETKLSWKEVDRDSANNEHRTECAFKFSNAVMYDLDID